MRNKKLGIAKNFDIKNAWLVKIFSSFCRNLFLTPSRDHTEFFNGCIKKAFLLKLFNVNDIPYSY
jgi:hypothetical protein